VIPLVDKYDAVRLVMIIRCWWLSVERCDHVVERDSPLRQAREFHRGPALLWHNYGYLIRTGARYSARRLSEFGQRLSMPLRQLFRICTGRVNRLLRTTRTVAREFLR